MLTLATTLPRPTAPKPALQIPPRANRTPRVIVIPGFMANDLSTAWLRAFLRRSGFDARCWTFGRNIGPIDGLMTRLLDHVRAAADGEAPLCLVGHSLGGIYAREIAKKAPHAVRSVVTLGSPVRALSEPHIGSNGAMIRLIERAIGCSISELHERGLFDDIAAPPPVHCTAIHSRRDRIAPWSSCLLSPSQLAENVEVDTTHRRMLASPTVFRVVADRLGRRSPAESCADSEAAPLPLTA